MIFDTATITADGFRIFTEAVSGDKIVWGSCLCSTDENGENPVAKGHAVSSYKSASTDIAYISCSMDNTAPGCVSGNANYFLLYAKKDGDDSESLVIKASVGENTPTKFPQYDASHPENTSLRGIVDFNIQMSQGVISTIDMTIAAYALATDLQNLSERVVTAHAPGGDTDGENQDIYGDKTFHGKMFVSGNYLLSTISSDSQSDGEASFRMSSGGGESATINLSCIYEGKEYMLKMDESGVNVDIETSSIVMSGSGVQITTSDETYCTINRLKVQNTGGLAFRVDDDSASFGTIVSFNNDIISAQNIVPALSNNGNIGTLQKRFSSLFVNEGNFQTIAIGSSAIFDDFATLNMDVEIDGVLRAKKGVPTLCSTSQTELDVGAISIIVMSRTSEEQMISAKKSGEKISGVDLHGYLVRIAKTGQIDSTGSTKFGGNPNTYRQVSIEDDMEFTLLCDFTGTPSASTYYFAIVMRTK